MRPLPRADLKVGFACNNRCVFCAQGDKRSDCPTLPLEELVRRLGLVRDRSQGLVLTGGEPTAHKELMALVRAARAMGFDPIQIQTNGRMLSYPRVVERLLAAGAREFSPSLHGSTALVHEGLTRAPGSFAETVEGIRNVVAAGAVVVTNSVITRANLHDLPALVALLASLGVRHAQLAFVHPVGTAEVEFDAVVPRLPTVVEPVRAARAVARAASMRLVTEAIPYCFLRGMEELAVEDDIPLTTVVDLDGRVGDHSRWREVEGKAHGPPCGRCARREACEGPWREYPARFGWDEFVGF
ncbi:MAG: radical SAM protein [Myxococcales bacterium]|nr:radical SAM protein [Myxococcales bacterium]